MNFWNADSDENVVHDYVYEGADDLRYDDEYTEAFIKAIEDMHAENPSDRYINDLMHPWWQYRDATVVDVPNDEGENHCTLWRLCFWKGPKDPFELRYVQVRLSTPNACQTTWNLAELSAGYKTERMGDHTKKKAIGGRAANNALKVFLGIKFGDDYRKYVEENAELKSLGDDGTKIVESNSITPICEFDTLNHLVVNGRTGKVCGLLLYNLWENDMEKYMDRVMKELEEILNIKFVKDQKGDFVADLYEDGHKLSAVVAVGYIDDDRSGCQMMVFSVDNFPGEDVQKEPKVKRLTSFLGATFGEDYLKYACERAYRQDWCAGVQSVSPANLNKFLDFDAELLYSKYSNRVVGVACVIEESKVSGDSGWMTGSVDKYMNQVKSILEEKYDRPCELIDEDDDGHGAADEDEVSKHEMIFREDENDASSKILAKIELYRRDGKIILTAIDMEEFKRATNPDSQRQKQRQNAIDAL